MQNFEILKSCIAHLENISSLSYAAEMLCVYILFHHTDYEGDILKGRYLIQIIIFLFHQGQKFSI